MFNGMLTGIIQRVGNANGVAASSHCTVQLPLGLSYEWCKLVLTGTAFAIADMTNIKLKLNGQTLQDYRTGTELEVLNSQQDRDYTTTAAFVQFDFRRMGCKPNQRGTFDRDMTMIRTGVPNNPSDPNRQGFKDVSTFTIEFDIGAGATAPVLNVYASMLDPAAMGLVRYVRDQDYTPAATGTYEIFDVPRQMIIERIGYNITSGVFTELQNKINGNVVFEGPLAIHNQEQGNGVRKVITNWFFIEPDPNGDGQDWIDARAASDFRQVLTVSTAAVIKTVIQYIGPLGA